MRRRSGLDVLRGDPYLRISAGGPESEDAKLRKAIDLGRKALPRL